MDRPFTAFNLRETPDMTKELMRYEDYKDQFLRVKSRKRKQFYLDCMMASWGRYQDLQLQNMRACFEHMMEIGL